MELWIDSKSYCAAPARQSVRLAGAMCSCSCSFCLSRRFYGASFALNEEEQYDLRMPVRITHVPEALM